MMTTLLRRTFLLGSLAATVLADQCDGFQTDLQWNVGHEYEHVCCGKAGDVEPAGFFDLFPVNLFSRLDNTGVTTFYDSVCGLPLFRAPIGRSWEEWQEESVQQGKPTFRDEEVVWENVVKHTDTSTARSVCGTHLGKSTTDSTGDLYSIDLVCIAGAPTQATVDPNSECLKVQLTTKIGEEDLNNCALDYERTEIQHCDHPVWQSSGGERFLVVQGQEWTIVSQSLKSMIVGNGGRCDFWSWSGAYFGGYHQTDFVENVLDLDWQRFDTRCLEWTTAKAVALATELSPDALASVPVPAVGALPTTGCGVENWRIKVKRSDAYHWRLGRDENQCNCMERCGAVGGDHWAFWAGRRRCYCYRMDQNSKVVESSMMMGWSSSSQANLFDEP